VGWGNNGNMTSFGSQTYTYDPVGNRLTYSGPDSTKTYTYDHANRLVLSKVEGLTQVVSGTLTTEFAYPSPLRLVSLSNRRAGNGAGLGSADHLRNRACMAQTRTA